MRSAFRLPFVQTRVLSRLSLALLGLFLLFAGSHSKAQTTYTGTVDFGTVNVGSSSGPQTLTFSFTSPTALNVTTPVQVLTTGVANLDFKSDGTGSCSGSTYSTCTVGVVFSPTAPGLRLGAVVIKGATGNVLATAYIHGAGHGPQVAFDPGLQSTIGTAKDTKGLAADGAGNIYVADASTPTSVYKVAPDGTQTTVTQLSSGPDGVAVDGAGNVYVAVPANSYIVKVTPAGVVTQVGTNIHIPGGLAVDGLGNLYIAQVDASNSAIVKLTPEGTQTTVGNGLATPAGVAVDAAGNIYVVNDNPSGSLVKIAPDSTQTTLVSSLSYPAAVAVDPAGNLYVTLQLAGQVVEYSPAGTQLRTFGHALANPVAVALDNLGNLYVNSGATTLKFARTPPTVGFLTSSVGVTSTDSPKTVTLEDIGNDTLTFPVPATGANPAVSSSFSLDSTTTCPQLTSASAAAGTLAIGTSCVYSVDFTPATTGTITGSLVVTDNSLNVANATQTITLNNQGTVVIIPATVTVSTLFATYNGSPMPVTVTTNPAGLAVTVTYSVIGSTTGGTTTPPTNPGTYMAVAVVTTPGYSGTGTGYVIINSPPPPTVPVITWPNPANITVGTPLSATQLDATTTIPGTFTYTPAAGTVLGVGAHTLSTTFTTTQPGYAPTTTKTATLIVQGNVQSIAPVSLGAVAVGATSTAQTVTFNFLNSVTLNPTTPVQVLTQGTAGLDFHGTGGTCAAMSYAAGGSCTVTVTMTPSAPGVRPGAVVLEDTTGATVATAYIYGTGQGPEIAYDTGVQSAFASGTVAEGVATDSAGNVYINTGSIIVKVGADGTQTALPMFGATFSSEGGIGVDGAGNVYIADTFGNRVLEFTPTAAYTLGAGFNTPYGLAVDAAGDVFVADTKNGNAVEITAAGVQSTVASGFVYPEGIAVDGAGNVYVSDNAGLGTGSTTPQGMLYKIAPGGAKSIVTTGILSAEGVAIDAAGNVFVAGDTNATVAKVAPTGVKTTFISGLSFPSMIAIDAAGNFYVAHATSSGGAVKLGRSTVPSFTFASTTVGSVSADSPQAFTLENIGNATLNFAKPSTGTNASISANYSLTPATTCPHSATASTLASGSTCVYSIQFLPATPGTITGSLTLTDNALLAANSVQTIALTGTGVAGVTAATVTLSNVNQTYTGSPLPVTVTTNPAGLAVSITYNGSATPPTTVGTYAVVATITASGYTGSATGTLVIAQAVPSITWANPTGITYGTALSATQLNATASVPGTFVYTPSAGTVLNAGTDTLNVVFTPTDAVDYTTATASVSIVVSQATPTITWANPAAITYGTALSATQLNATGSVPGTFVYTPAAGTIPTAGTGTLSVTFTPTDTANYTTATRTVSIVVNQATPTITWANPASITYGTALSATQLNATASVPGTFAYTPAAGTIPAAGTDTLNVTFTPTDTTDYTTATANVSITVTQATPAVTWTTPAAITYGTALSAAQLNATASVPGTFVYTPAAGTIPAVGTDTLSVTFTPTDTTDYAAVTKTVSIVVGQATPVITWANPAAIAYGTALSTMQLNATASVAGTFAYTPAVGTVLPAGSDTLNVTFTPMDTTDYTTATKSVTIVVNPATLTVTAANATRVYGTANPTFTGSVSGNVNGDTFTETFTTAATALSNVGTYAIVPAVTGNSLASYTQTVVNGTLTITQASSTTTLGVNNTNPASGQTITLTAQVASATSGTPTGSVQFLDGSTVLNTASLSGGTATFATSALALGAHSVTAVYLGDTNFIGSNSGAAQVVTVSGNLDFTINAITQTQTVIPGAIASYSFNVAPVSGNYPSSVTFTASGLPPGATATFSPSSIAASGGAQTVTVTIQTSTAIIARNSLPPITLALLLLPLAGARRFQKSGKRLARMACMLLLLGGGALATGALSGCGTNNGFFGQAPKTYNVTIAATSGTVSHTATVTLDLE